MEGDGLYPPEEIDLKSLETAKKRFLNDGEFIPTPYSKSKKESLAEAIEAPITLCVGKPGTGKTFTVNSLINDGLVKGRINAALMDKEGGAIEAIASVLSGGREVKDVMKYLKRADSKAVCIDEAAFLSKTDYEKIRTLGDESGVRLILVYHNAGEIGDFRMASRILTRIDFEGLDFNNFKYYLGHRSDQPHTIALISDEFLREIFDEISDESGHTGFREINKIGYALFDVMESILRFEGEVEFKRSLLNGKAARMALLKYAKQMRIPIPEEETKEIK